MMNINNSKTQRKIAAAIVIVIVLAMVAGAVLPALV